MHHKIAKRIVTNPKAQMDFVLQGKLPRLKHPENTPLRNILSRLTPRIRCDIKGVKLSPKLGYQSDARFSNLEQLWQWLGADKMVGEWESSPACSRVNRRFRGEISLDLLLDHCSSYPDKAIIERNFR